MDFSGSRVSGSRVSEPDTQDTSLHTNEDTDEDTDEDYL